MLSLSDTCSIKTRTDFSTGEVIFTYYKHILYVRIEKIASSAINFDDFFESTKKKKSIKTLEMNLTKVILGMRQESEK